VCFPVKRFLWPNSFSGALGSAFSLSTTIGALQFGLRNNTGVAVVQPLFSLLWVVPFSGKRSVVQIARDASGHIRFVVLPRSTVSLGT